MPSVQFQKTQRVERRHKQTSVPNRGLHAGKERVRIMSSSVHSGRREGGRGGELSRVSEEERERERERVAE